MPDHTTKPSNLDFLWRHYYRCPSCQDDWAHQSRAVREIGSCPVCTRRTSPYESEICLVLRP